MFPLLIAFFLIGLLGMAITPREEDPQISVPMVDIFVAYPGAAASEVANLVSEPLERLMSELPGVKHVYSMSRDGLSMVTVRFEVGERMETSLVKLYNKLYSNMDLIPKGVMQPLVKPKSIDDVPVATVTLSSSKLDLVQLRKLGLDVLQRFKALPNTGQSFVTGGSREQVRIDVDPPRMSSHKVTLSQIAQAVGAANQRISRRRHRGRGQVVQHLHRRLPGDRRRRGESGHRGGRQPAGVPARRRQGDAMASRRPRASWTTACATPTGAL